jgi:hypothetical protein
VPGHVGQRFLRGAQQRGFGLERQRPHRPGGADLDRDPVQPRPALRDVAERVGQPGGFQRLGTQRVHRPPRLGQALPGQPGRRVEVAAPPGRVAGGLPGRLELGDDPGEALREGVMNLPCQPLPLV